MEDDATRLNRALEGRYEILEEIGRGGMADVFLAQDLKHRRKVALLPLFDSGEAEGFLYYVMPYLEGESLHEILDRERQLPVDEAVKISTEVADFGIARAVRSDGEERLNRTGFLVGTPVDAIPEQLAGEESVDGRTDLYSLARVLHEMLTGESPFQAPTMAAILAHKVESGAR